MKWGEGREGAEGTHGVGGDVDVCAGWLSSARVGERAKERREREGKRQDSPILDGWTRSISMLCFSNETNQSNSREVGLTKLEARTDIVGLAVGEGS
jgi:hypothetical protein